MSFKPTPPVVTILFFLSLTKVVVPALPTLLPRPAVSVVLQRKTVRNERPAGCAMLLHKIADGVVFVRTPHPPIRRGTGRILKVFDIIAAPVVAPLQQS